VRALVVSPPLPGAGDRVLTADALREFWYLRRTGDSVFRAFKLDVLRVEGDVIAEITTFGAQPFAGLGLAATL
jgi:hypothetical protein